MQGFRSRIIFLFLIPAVFIIYFTFHYLNLSNAKIQSSSQQITDILLIEKLVDLIHAIQIERGLSAGYIVMDSALQKNTKKELSVAFHTTDTAIQTLRSQAFNIEVFPIGNIQKIRKKTIQNHISFTQEMQFYTNINKHIINYIKYLLPKLTQNRYETFFLIDIEKIKENAGLERACVYNQLISKVYNEQCMQKVLFIQKKQEELEEEIFSYAPQELISLYKNYITQENIKELHRLRKLYNEQRLALKDAKNWFQVTSKRINAFNQISKETLELCKQKLTAVYNEAENDLSISIILWIISILSAIYFVYLINKLLKQYEKYTHELKLASYTMDSYEGILITDADTKILKVNKGFERITGYSFEDVKGKKPTILKSGKHSKEYYETMWNELKNRHAWSGEILNRRKDGDIYHQKLSISSVRDDKGNVINYVGHLFDITALKMAQQEAQYQANHDALTKLINRKALMERLQEELQRAKRHHFTNAFLFIDLDHFKNVNDTYGHHIGDELLIYVANTLQSLVREEDIVARISGDEFAIVLLNIDKNNEETLNIVEKISHKIIELLSQEIMIEKNPVTIGASIGVRIFPQEHDTIEKIVKDADSAMYNAKYGGKNRFSFF